MPLSTDFWTVTKEEAELYLCFGGLARECFLFDLNVRSVLSDCLII